MASATRRQQRDIYRQANFFRIKNNLMRFSEMAVEWYTARRNEGIEKMKNFENQTFDSLEHQRTIRLNKAKEDWKSEGYNEDEIKMLEESWLILSDKNSEDWHAEKKTARQLSKQALNSRKNRV